MKSYLTLILVFLIFVSCVDPMRLIKKEKDYKALEASMNLLKRKRIKEDHVMAFELSFDMVTKKDAAKVELLRNSGNPKNWLKILEKAEVIYFRQARVKRLVTALSNKGYFPTVEMYPAKELVKEAKDNVALYYYAQALEFIPAAENGDRLKARSAYDNLEKCLSYREEFRDANELLNKMYAIGTTHIYLIPELDEEAIKFSERLFDVFFENNVFPFRKDWSVLYLEKPENEEIDYQVRFHFEELYVSSNQVSESTCSASDEIQTGCESVQVWSAKDSAYVTEQVPVYETIYLEVTTFEQSKYAELKLVGDVFIFENEELMPFKFDRRRNWSNSYSKKSGDSRVSGCSQAIGFCQTFPSDGSLFEDCARYVKGDFSDWLARNTY